MSVPAIWLAVALAVTAQPEAVPPLQEIEVTSSKDNSKQPSLLWAPQAEAGQRLPVLVYLHSWSGDYLQDNSAWQKEAVARKWIYLHPNFRGPNFQPTACGSELARQDILDALDYVIAHYPVDRDRIYLAGSSGGGHMSLLMAGYHSERFSAVSAWVGITDLAAWQQFHTRDGKMGKYAQDVVACCGGIPRESEAVIKQYVARSPIYHLHRVGTLPLDICAGVTDGHNGSVPIMHSLNAFNVIAKVNDKSPIPQEQIDELWNSGRLSQPTEEDTKPDPSYGRELLLRRHAGPSRVNIFQGGHEGLPVPACTWLAEQKRRTQP